MELDFSVAVILHKPAHIFPHDVGHSRSKEAVLYVERVQVIEGLFKGVTCRVAAFTVLVTVAGCNGK